MVTWQPRYPHYCGNLSRHLNRGKSKGRELKFLPWSTLLKMGWKDVYKYFTCFRRSPWKPVFPFSLLLIQPGFYEAAIFAWVLITSDCLITQKAIKDGLPTSSYFNPWGYIICWCKWAKLLQGGYSDKCQQGLLFYTMTLNRVCMAFSGEVFSIRSIEIGAAGRLYPSCSQLAIVSCDANGQSLLVGQRIRHTNGSDFGKWERQIDF